MMRALALVVLLAGCSSTPAALNTGSAPLDENPSSRPRCNLRWPDGIHAEARCLRPRPALLMTDAEKAPAPPPVKDTTQPRCFAPYTLGTRDGFLMCNIYERLERSA